MQLTPNLNLKKPEGTDIVDIVDLNSNTDKLDAEVVKLASPTAPGRMSAADKTKLDGATSAVTASTLVQRDAGGRFKAAAPAAVDDVARKQEITDHADVKATTTQWGHTKLNDSTASTSASEAATANSVKKAYDHADRVAVTVLADGTDLNTVVKAGFYRLQGNHPNWPSNAVGYGQMLVIRGGGDTITQMVFGYSDPARTFIRSGNPPAVNGSGTWSEWASLMTARGGTFTGNVTMGAGSGLYLENNVGLVGKTTSGAGTYLAYVAANNNAIIGGTGIPTSIHSSSEPNWWNGSVLRDLIHSGGGQQIGGSLDVIGPLHGGHLYATGRSGATGGSAYLRNPEANTNLAGDHTTLNVFASSFRIYESGGNTRGVSLDLTQCAAGAGSDLLHTGVSRRVWTGASAPLVYQIGDIWIDTSS